MEIRFNSILGRLCVQLLVTWLSIFAGAFPLLASAQEAEVPNGWESYLSRPDILSEEVRAQAGGLELGADWPRIRAAHFVFLAELFEMYPRGTELYFLARDSEYLYDLAKLVTAGTHEESRIHLLNVTRKNVDDPNLKSYLAENGISEASLRAGKKVLFVDTGFEGTIPKGIASIFPKELGSQLKTQLIVSDMAGAPSSRSFLIHLNRSANDQVPAMFHDALQDYEDMPHYTNQSTRYEFKDGRWHPMSSLQVVKSYFGDPQASKEASLLYMKDLKHEWSKPDVRALFVSARERLRLLKAFLKKGNERAQREIKSELLRLRGSDEGRLFEAQVRDALEMQKNAEFSTPFKLQDLGLRGDVLNSRGLAPIPAGKSIDLFELYGGPSYAPAPKTCRDLFN